MVEEKIEAQELLLDQIRDLSKRWNQRVFDEIFAHQQLTDIADALAPLHLDRIKHFFKSLKPDAAALILEHASRSFQQELLVSIRVSLGCKFLFLMASDKAADILQELLENHNQKGEAYLRALKGMPKAAGICELLSYKGSHQAAAMMSTAYLAIPEDLSVSEAIKVIKSQDFPDHQSAFYVFIIDSKNCLKGYTDVHKLLLAPAKEKVKTFRKEAISVQLDDDLEYATQLVQKYDLLVLPVLDEEGRLVGVITEDDVVDVVVEEANEDLYKLSGTRERDEEALVQGSIVHVLKARIPWLLLSVGGGLVASLMMSLFAPFVEQKALFSLGLFLSFIPLLMGLAGNIGNQTATIVVRALATGGLVLNQYIGFLCREFVIGLGIALCVIVSVLPFLIAWAVPSLLIVLVCVTILLNSFVAVLIGVSLPFFLKQISIDPAIASAPFISTCLDVFGQCIYFVLLFLYLS